MNEQYTRAPHRRSQPGSGPSPNAALMIDFDNVTMAIRSNLGQELRNFLTSDIVRGKVSVQRAYADWRRYPQYIVPLSEASIDLIFAPAYGSSKKNATDIRLAIDCLELVFTRPEIGTYILLSGDSDFSSLVLKLKEYGKYVIGVGLQESTSDLLVQNCDEYYSYNSLSGLTSAEEMTAQSHDPWELVSTAVQRMEERDDVMRSDRLKQVMLEIDGGFDEKDHGFSKFNRFLAEASSRGLVRLRKMSDGQYEVAPGADVTAAEKTDGGPPEQATATANGGRGGGRGERGRRRGGRGGGRKAAAASAPTPPPKIEAASLREAYDLLADVVGDLAGDGEPVRDSEVKREMLRRNKEFDEAELGFSKFSRFLRQAHDEEVVDVEKDEDGNYHLAPAGEGATPTRKEPERQPEPREERATEPAAEERIPEPEEEEGAREPEEEAEAVEAPAAGAPSEPSGTEPSGTEEEERGPAEQPRRTGRRGGLGRFRSGSRGPGSGSAGPSEEEGEGVPGPVGSATDGAESSEEEEQAAETKPAPGRRSGRTRRGLGRFRRGQGGSGTEEEASEESSEPVAGPAESEPAEEPAASGERRAAEEPGGEETPGGEAVGQPVPGEPAADTAAAPTSGAAPVGPSEDPVEHMMGSYPGVGRKTAEKLVEAFGDEIFDVIDREPGRLTEVLPEHRAQAVIEARQAERERVGA